MKPIIDTKKVVPVGAGDLAPKPTLDRTTMVTQLYFARHGEQPAGFDFRCTHAAPPAGEDPWVRRLDIGAAWAAPDLGWLADNAGTMAIENTAGTGRTTNPTDKERLAIAAQVIEVSFDGADAPACTIPPGGHMVFTPVNAGAVRLRCAVGCKARLVALPRDTGHDKA